MSLLRVIVGYSLCFIIYNLQFYSYNPFDTFKQKNGSSTMRKILADMLIRMGDRVGFLWPVEL